MTKSDPQPTKPSLIWRWMRFLNQRVALKNVKRLPIQRKVLILTTTGRKSGLPRQTPLQYEEINGLIYVASARGTAADWYRNLQKQPQVLLKFGDRQLSGVAETVTEPAKIADFLQYRLEHHPRMIGAIMRLEGLPWCYTRADLEKFAQEKALAVIRPQANAASTDDPS
jgi:deazaflavin-dependent oxidoreductase (nitroreductase family)